MACKGRRRLRRRAILWDAGQETGVTGAQIGKTSIARATGWPDAAGVSPDKFPPVISTQLV